MIRMPDNIKGRDTVLNMGGGGGGGGVMIVGLRSKDEVMVSH